MYTVKQNIINTLFTLLALSLITLSLFSRWDVRNYNNSNLNKDPIPPQETYIKGVNYYLLKNSHPHLTLKADELISNSKEKKTFFFRPIGHVFMKNGDKVFYKGDKGIYLQSTKYLKLEGHIDVKSRNMHANSSQMIYEALKDRVHLIKNVKARAFIPKERDWVHLKSHEAYIWPEAQKSRFFGHVEGRIKREKVYESSLFFWTQELFLNMNTNKADLHQNVKIEKENIKASSRHGKIFLENYNKGLKYYALYDDVQLTEKIKVEGKFVKRKAFSEKLEGFPSEDSIILTGYPKVFQGKDMIKGNKIILRSDTEVVEVDDANTKFKVN